MKAKEKATPGEEAAAKILTVWGRGTSPAELNDVAFRLGLLVSAGLMKHSRVIYLLDWHMDFRKYDSDQISMSRDAVERGIATPVTPAQIYADNDNAPRQTDFTAAELQHKKYDPIKYIVPGYLADGGTLFAGRPKIGKSWLALDMALGVSRGSTCLGGLQCVRGDVLYLALEDNERRLNSRIDKLMPFIPGAVEPWPANLHLHTEWPRADAGGLDKIEAWLDQHPAARLVVIDVLAMFRPVTTNKNAYEQDYNAIKSLQGIASRRNIAILIVTHTRKARSESGDPFETISGTLGLSGAADAALILDRDTQGAKLYARGRDIDVIESAVMFDKMSCRWRVLGEAGEVRRSDERAAILSVLIEAGEPVKAGKIAEAIGKNKNTVNQLLFKMAKAGEVDRAGRGEWIHPLSASNSIPGKNDKKIKRENGTENDVYLCTDFTGLEAANDNKPRGTTGTGNNEWYTPKEYIDLARSVLGVIDLDPASNVIAQETVQAKAFFTKEENGLKREWHGNVWLNPPYSRGSIGKFVSKLVAEKAAGHVEAAILLTHNGTDTAWFRQANQAASAVCFANRRVKFLSPTGEIAAPTQGQTFFYFGGDVEGFARVFASTGEIMTKTSPVAA